MGQKTRSNTDKKATKRKGTEKGKDEDTEVGTEPEETEKNRQRQAQANQQLWGKLTWKQA